MNFQETMYCAVEQCSAVGQVMWGGKWWCKAHAPEGGQEFVDVATLRAAIANLARDNAACHELLQRCFDEFSHPHADGAWVQELLGDIDRLLREN